LQSVLYARCTHDYKVALDFFNNAGKLSVINLFAHLSLNFHLLSLVSSIDQTLIVGGFHCPFGEQKRSETFSGKIIDLVVDFFLELVL
jgi:hypothetical protein